MALFYERLWASGTKALSESPHPASGHPLPIRWGEGRVRGSLVGSWNQRAFRETWPCYKYAAPNGATQRPIRESRGPFQYESCAAPLGNRHRLHKLFAQDASFWSALIDTRLLMVPQ